jgi:hypothetical protein
MVSGILLLGLMAAHGEYRGRSMKKEVELRARLVRELGLSDLCLFTEARYTRHPSVTDLYSAFQDHPLSLEHFPSGSLMGPPGHITKGGRADGAL